MNEMDVSHTNTTSEIAKLILSQDDWGVLDEPQSLTDDLDEISFKPLTEGLGFSKPAPRMSELKKSSVARVASKDFKYIDRPLKNKKEMLQEMSSRVMASTISDEHAKISHLSAFYDQRAQTPKKVKKVKKIKHLKASASQRLTAWAIDSVLITLLLLGFVGAISAILELNFTEVLLYQGKGFLLSFWSLLYVLYFTVLDLDRSFGKSLLRVKIIKHRQQISIVDTFIRTVTSLISVLCFGIPFLFDLHGHLSDTKVVKWK